MARSQAGSSGGAGSQSVPPVSADRAEYAAQSEEERRRTRDRQRRPDGSFYGDGSPASPDRPAVEIVDRDITQWRDTLEARQDSQTAEQITNPLGLGTPGGQTQDDTNPFSDTVDLEAAWSDRRWVLYDEARRDAETADPSEFMAWVRRDREPGAQGELDAARFEGMNNALARESIEDWKARMRRAEEYGAATVLGSATRRDPNNPVVEQVTGPTQAQQFVDPQTGRVVMLSDTSGFKAAPTPTAAELAEQLKASGQTDMVFIGWEGKYGGGQGVVAPVLMSRESLRYFDNFPPEMQDRVMEITRLYYEGMDPQFSWNEKRWKEAINIAHSALHANGQYKSPFEAYEQVLIRWRAQEEEKKRTSGGGGGGFYGGGGGGGSASTQRITLTSVTDAYYLLNQAMSTYLGRSPSQQELARFVKMLNAQEMANPVVATATGDTTMQEGGFNPAVFAEEFAKGTEGSAEYRSATTFLDTLIGALDGQTGVI